MGTAFICHGCGEEIKNPFAIEITDGYKQYFHDACARKLGVNGKRISIYLPILSREYIATILLEKMAHLLVENRAAYLEVHVCVLQKMVTEECGYLIPINEVYKTIREYFPELHFGENPIGRFIKVELKTLNKYTK